MTRLPVTAAGYASLQDELKICLRTRLQLAERVRAAITDDPNMVENSEYHAAISDQELNNTRIADLQSKLTRAEIIDPAKLSGETVRFGATVTLIDEDSKQKKILQIVGEPEADAARGKISVASPVARAIIGKPQNASVEVVVPDGVRFYKISRIRWDGQGS